MARLRRITQISDTVVVWKTKWTGVSRWFSIAKAAA